MGILLPYLLFAALLPHRDGTINQTSPSFHKLPWLWSLTTAVEKEHMAAGLLKGMELQSHVLVFQNTGIGMVLPHTLYLLKCFHYCSLTNPSLLPVTATLLLYANPNFILRVKFPLLSASLPNLH